MDETPKDVDGILYRFKQPSEKTFLTPFGQMTLFRNLFQADEGGPSYVMRGMTGEYVILEVREAVLFAADLITPEEAVSLLEKTALFVPSATAVKHMIEEAEQWLEEMGEGVNQSIRKEEDIPPDTQVMVANLDGTTLRLREPGQSVLLRNCATRRRSTPAFGLSVCGSDARKRLAKIEGSI